MNANRQKCEPGSLKSFRQESTAAAARISANLLSVAVGRSKPDGHDADGDDSSSSSGSEGGMVARQEQDSHGDDILSNEHTRSSSLVLDPVAQVTALNYVAEHRIFLKAILELLSQRDTYSGIEVDMNDPNTIKAGPLKKASRLVRGAWKQKYVEIRRGLLSYYENEKEEEERLVRKNVALQANTTTCRKVQVQGLRTGFVFELAVEGRPKRLWMANSREERQAWINAICNAMVGGSVVRGDTQVMHHAGKRKSVISSRSPYKRDLEEYLRVQDCISRAGCKEEYVGSLFDVVGESLNVPVQWIRERFDTAEQAFHEEDTSVGVGQLWKDLNRDSVCINGETFRGDCGHGPERIIGALTRSIMMLEQSFADRASAYPTKKSYLTESQALSYARDVLLAGNRTRSGGDSYFCVDTLCKNSLLAVLCPSTAEADPVSITVEPMDAEHRAHDLSGWLKSRSRPQKPWKKRYFVLSEGTLSYYEQAKPRPHGLRGQLLLPNATLQISEENIPSKEKGRNRLVVSIVMDDATKDRQLCFDDQNKFYLWMHALEEASNRNAKRSTSLTKTVVSKIRRGLRDESDGIPKDSGDGGGGGSTSLKEYAATQGLEGVALDRRVALLRTKSGKAKSAVKISVRASTEYKICTMDPQGNEREDTWAWIRASFLQNFTVSGGPNGRMKRGEEIVQICVQENSKDA